TGRSPRPGTPGSATSTPPRTTGSAPANAVSGSAWPATRARSTWSPPRWGACCGPAPAPGTTAPTASPSRTTTCANGTSPRPGCGAPTPTPSSASAWTAWTSSSRTIPRRGRRSRPPPRGSRRWPGRVDRGMASGRYTLLEQHATAELLAACLEHGVGIIAVSVFTSGLLAQHQVPDDVTYEYSRAPAEIIERARALARIAERHGATLPDLAVQFPLRHEAVRSVVLGMRTAEQVRSNAHRMSAPIPAAAWEDVEGTGPDAAAGDDTAPGGSTDDTR